MDCDKVVIRTRRQRSVPTLAPAHPHVRWKWGSRKGRFGPLGGLETFDDSPYVFGGVKRTTGVAHKRV